jgi:hypothetical protein
MSTRGTIRLERDEATGQGIHLYREVFDDVNHLYVALEGFHFEAASSMNLSGEWGPRLTLKLPNEWARKLGLIAVAPQSDQATADDK